MIPLRRAPAPKSWAFFNGLLDFTEAIGYRGEARYVGFYYIPDADDLIFADGQSSGTAATWVFQSYRRHRAVGHLLDGTGIDGYPPTHWLLIDREANRASIAPAAEARAFLHAQHPPEPEMTPEQREVFEAELMRLWEEQRNRPFDPADIANRGEEQRRRVGRLMSWPDMCPEPPERGQSPG